MNYTFKLFFLLGFYFINFNLSGQDLANLDRKYGFNKFKLESNYNLYKDELKYNFSDKDGVKYYYYQGNDVKEIFETAVETINLGFYNQRLYTIAVEFLEKSSYNQKNVQNGLKEIFGYQEVGYKSETKINPDMEWSMKWETNKTYLQVDKVSCKSTNFNSCAFALFLFSKKLKSEILNSKF